MLKRGFTVLKKPFPHIKRFKSLENGFWKKSLIWKFSPWFWLKFPCFPLISLTGKTFQKFPCFPWLVGTLTFLSLGCAGLAKIPQNDFTFRCPHVYHPGNRYIDGSAPGKVITEQYHVSTYSICLSCIFNYKSMRSIYSRTQ